MLLTAASKNVLADSAASVGLLIAFYYGLTAFTCVWFFRRTLFSGAARHRAGVFSDRYDAGKVAVLAVAAADGMGIPLSLGDPDITAVRRARCHGHAT